LLLPLLHAAAAALPCLLVRAPSYHFRKLEVRWALARHQVSVALQRAVL
jgi:hypothetical protein